MKLFNQKINSQCSLYTSVSGFIIENNVNKIGI